MARMQPGRRERERRIDRQWKLIEGCGGLGLVLGFLLYMDAGMRAADTARCADGPHADFSGCLVRQLVHGATAIAPSVLVLGLLGAAIGLGLGQLLHGTRSARR